MRTMTRSKNGGSKMLIINDRQLELYNGIVNCKK